GPEEGTRVLAGRAPRPDLAPDASLPEDTRLWALLQQAVGGSLGGRVFPGGFISPPPVRDPLAPLPRLFFTGGSPASRAGGGGGGRGRRGPPASCAPAAGRRFGRGGDAAGARPGPGRRAPTRLASVGSRIISPPRYGTARYRRRPRRGAASCGSSSGRTSR